jgi:hypothetical protein
MTRAELALTASAAAPHLGGEYEVDLPRPELVAGVHRGDDGALEANPVGVAEEPAVAGRRSSNARPWVILLRTLFVDVA